MEVEGQTGAVYGESPERLAHRNGYRDRTSETRPGTVELRIPKLRRGCYFAVVPKPLRMADKALTTAVQEAYVQGVFVSDTQNRGRLQNRLVFQEF